MKDRMAALRDLYGTTPTGSQGADLCVSVLSGFAPLAGCGEVSIGDTKKAASVDNAPAALLDPVRNSGFRRRMLPSPCGPGPCGSEHRPVFNPRSAANVHGSSITVRSNLAAVE
jgi:hypothetical protein